MKLKSAMKVQVIFKIKQIFYKIYLTKYNPKVYWFDIYVLREDSKILKLFVFCNHTFVLI